MGDKKDKKQTADEAQLAQKDEQIKDLKDTLQRLQAEFENYKKRKMREEEDLRRHASKELILDLLPAIDNLELALKNAEQDSELRKGVEMIYAQIMDLLEKRGVTQLEVKGQYDPELHEALLTGEGKDGEILEVLQKGYLINDRVLRTAKVKIGKE